MADHSKQHYYGAVEKGGWYYGRVYHYDTTGNRIIEVYRHPEGRSQEPMAVDDASDWIDANMPDGDVAMD